ncbi:hypothetical protein OPQ81_011721 [Rhizoctonia solani]|nr:hypothetical protein OPQ81_011721 [Rhizoctonia solani]
MPPIPTLPLNDKRGIPAIAFGTGTALYGRDATAYVVQAIEGGFNHIDTAQVYRNEESVGQALRQTLGETSVVRNDSIDVEKQKLRRLFREDIWVTTKYGGEIDAEEALDISLKKLGLSYVDLYLIHWPQFAPDILKTWSELERAHAHGKAKSIGVSNFSIDQLKLILEHGKIPPAVNQIPLHPYNYHEQAELLEFANKHGIRIESYNGLTPITKLPGGPVDAVVEGIAKRLGPKVTPAQVLMSWIRAKGVVIVTTTSRKERIAEYLNTFKLPSLTNEEVAAIDEAGKHPPSPERPAGCVLAQQETSWVTASVAMVLLLQLLYRLRGCDTGRGTRHTETETDQNRRPRDNLKYLDTKSQMEEIPCCEGLERKVDTELSVPELNPWSKHEARETPVWITAEDRPTSALGSVMSVPPVMDAIVMQITATNNRERSMCISQLPLEPLQPKNDDDPLGVPDYPA